MKNIKIILSPTAEEIYKFLIKESKNSKIENSILNAFNKKIEIRINPVSD